MMKSWKIMAVMFSAAAVFAADSDYEAMSKYVPASNDGLAYLNTEKLSGSPFVDEIKKLAEMAEMSALPDDDGALLVSLNSAAPDTSVSVLLKINGVTTLDDLAAKIGAADKVTVKKVKYGDRDALRIDEQPLAIYAVDSGIFAMIPDGQAEAFFSAAKGVSGDLSGRIAPLSDNPLFGSFKIQPTAGDAMAVNRCDFTGMLSNGGKGLALKLMAFLPDEKTATQAAQEIQGGLMMLTMTAAQKDPALGSMLMTAIKIKSEQNIMNVDLNITPDLLAKLQELNAAQPEPEAGIVQVEESVTETVPAN
ncbi:MAG: hypothetical protein PHI85_01760 [Victivallaceae bacterium]|nr:hypothetical protein [Victivallaceae bacterium]